MKIKKLLKYLSASAAGIIVPILASAQVDTGLSAIQNSFPSSGVGAARTPIEFITWIINTMLLFAGIVAVVFTIIGGYQYISAGGNAEQAEKGKTTVINAIIGVVIIILSYVIINVIVNLVGNNRA